ncbi:lytic transglycosylase domain-containing protein [Proteus mirabilis]|nr:lytic transglycosylase domain-containing protein [Proteus mirabilis]
MANFFDQFDEQKLPNGMIEKGNIDIHNRPVVKNEDGSISTVRSLSANIDGMEVLIPTVSDDGRIMSDDEAIDNYLRTGKHLGMFSTPEDATAYAESLHNQQAEEYLPQVRNFFDQFDASAQQEQGTQPAQPENSYIAGMKQTNQNLSQGLQQSSEDAKSFRENVIDAFTGESKMTPEVQGLEGIMSSPEMNAFNTDAMKAAWVQMFGNDNDFVKVIGNMGGKVSQDEKGNLLVDLPSGRYALNKPGLSAEDIMPFIANAAAFTPAGRASTVLGATAKSAGTDLALQSSVNMAGGSDINPLQTALSAGLGGGFKAAEKLINSGYRVATGKPTQEASELSEFAKQNNVPLYTTDVVPPQSKTGRLAQGAAENIPFAGTAGLRSNQQEARSKLVRDFADRFGEYDPSQVVESLKRKTSTIKQAAGERLESIQNALSGVPITPNRAINQIDSEISKLSKLGEVADTQTISKLQSYRNELASGNVDISQLRDLRTQFRQDVKGERMAMSNRSDAAINRVYKAMSDDASDAISSNLGADALRKYNQANAIYADEANKILNTRLKSILTKGDLTPEVVNNILFSKNKSEIRSLYNSVDTRGRAQMRNAIIGKAIEKAGDSPDQFLRQLNIMSNQTGIAFRGQDAIYINGLKKYLEATKQAAKAGVTTPTGQQAIPFILGLGAAIKPSTAIGAGTYGALARIYESKPVREAVMRLAGTPAGTSKFEKAVSTISQSLSAGTQAEVRN